MMADILNEDETGVNTTPNVTAGVAGKENSGNPPERRKGLEDAVARAKETAHRIVKAKENQ